MRNDFQQELIEILNIPESETSPLSIEMEESFYATAFGLYENGDYRGASQLFTQLVLTNPYSEHYWQGLAGSKQMTRDYQAAVHAWSMVVLFKEADPLPYFHVAECLLSLEEKDEALKAIDAALDRCGNHGPLYEKIHLLKTLHYDTC